MVANCPTSTKSHDCPMFVSIFCKGYFERSRATAFDDNDYNDNQAHHGDCHNGKRFVATTGIVNDLIETL